MGLDVMVAAKRKGLGVKEQRMLVGMEAVRQRVLAKHLFASLRSKWLVGQLRAAEGMDPLTTLLRLAGVRQDVALVVARPGQMSC